MQTSLLFYSLVFTHVVYATYHLKEHSLSPPYQSHYWSSYGSTVLEPRFVRLTSDAQSLQGGIYNVKPVTSRDWEVTILFHVHGEGKTLFGDGFAFWYTEHPPSPGPAFGSRDIFRGLAIFFDTYANQNGEHSHEHPYVSAMVNDGSKRYDHDKDGTITELKGCSSNFRNNDYSIVIIRYEGNQLSVKFKYEGTDKLVDCFTVDGVHLPIGYYFGVSAATGELSDNHDIYAIQAYELDVSHSRDDIRIDPAKIQPHAEQESPARDRIDDRQPVFKGNHFIWLLITWGIIFGVLGGIAYLCYSYYRKRQRQMKRLY